jgi:hypothetical protein
VSAERRWKEVEGEKERKRILKTSARFVPSSIPINPPLPSKKEIQKREVTIRPEYLQCAKSNEWSSRIQEMKMKTIL